MPWSHSKPGRSPVGLEGGLGWPLSSVLLWCWGRFLTFLGLFPVSFSSCFFSGWLAPQSTPCLWSLFFHPQQNSSHQGNWWWGVWEKQELLHWDDGPPHGGYEFSERCSTLSCTLTLTPSSPLLFPPFSYPFISFSFPFFCLSGSLSLFPFLSSLFLSPSPLSAPSSVLTPASLSHGIIRGMLKSQCSLLWDEEMDIGEKIRERESTSPESIIYEALCFSRVV